MFTVHSRRLFTQDKLGYFSNSKLYGGQWDREKVFTIKRCSLIRGVHYERFRCTANIISHNFIQFNKQKNIQPCTNIKVVKLGIHMCCQI